MLSVCNSLDVPEPSLWPISNMARFGTTPKGKPRFRVVFSPTVRKLVFGQFADGYIGARSRPAYPHLGQVWILEKWISGEQATNMTPGEYEKWGPRDPQSGMLIEGPYPAEGIYHHCWTFDADTLQGGMDGAVEKIIGLIQRGEKRSASELRAGNAELDRKKEDEDARNRFLRVRETEPLYGIRPASFPRGPKTVNHKTQRTPVSANDLVTKGFPARRGSMMSMKGRNVEWPSTIPA